MTSKTLAKALAIYQRGGVEWTGAYSYRVTSTSGEVYGVWLEPEHCTCPATVTCSHMAAVDIYRSKRRERRAATV